MTGRSWMSGLGTRLLVAQFLIAASVLGVAWVGHADVHAAEERVLRVYDHRMLPLSELARVADDFAIDFVDAVHKVSDGSFSPEQGLRVLRRVDVETNARFVRAKALMTAPNERQLLNDLRPVLDRALASLHEALSLMSAGDTEGLRKWRIRELYARVDPLTARLQALIAKDLDAAHADVLALRGDLATSATESAVGLALAAAFAVGVGFLIVARFLGSLRQIDRVLGMAASGVLSGRVRLRGNDELSVMAAHVDHMIEAIEKSQRELSDQAARLTRSEAETRAASAAKSLFLSNVSHELRTPLNVILGYAQILRRDRTLTADTLRGLSRILESGTYLLELIDDVLGIARVEAGTLALVPKPFSPHDLLAELGRMLGPRAREKALTLDVSERGELPRQLYADRRRLLQVLLNLASNAVKFTARGTVSVCMEWADGRLCFEVKDTGPGIGAVERTHLFRQFSQGEAGRKSAEGTGLGLHISQALVRAMGGEIELVSEPGQGARFVFTAWAPETAAPAEVRRESSDRRAGSDVKFAPMLVVDDRPTNREVLRALLETSGFAVEEAASGTAALDYLAAHESSLVWLDLRMPEPDGFQTVTALREREAIVGGGRRTPVVAITASVADFGRAEALSRGFDDFVPKPFRADAILDAIERLLGIRLEGQPAHPPAAEPSAESFDLSALSTTERRDLRDLLMLGDVPGAVALARALGPSAEGLKREIEGFRGEGILATLRRFERD